MPDDRDDDTQDTNTQTNVIESRVILGGSPSSGSLERRQEMMAWEAIPLMLRSSSSGWATREMGATFAMGGCVLSPLVSGESGGTSR